MSRIGLKPIVVPAGVEVISVTDSRELLKYFLENGMRFIFQFAIISFLPTFYTCLCLPLRLVYYSY